MFDLVTFHDTCQAAQLGFAFINGAAMTTDTHILFTIDWGPQRLTTHNTRPIDLHVL